MFPKDAKGENMYGNQYVFRVPRESVNVTPYMHFTIRLFFPLEQTADASSL